LDLNQASARVMQYIFFNLLDKGTFCPGILKLQDWNVVKHCDEWTICVLV
jgi:hypothetical protein